MFENWSTIKKLIWLKYTVLAAKVKEILYTLSGSSPLSFDQAVAKPMEHLITNIKPVQNLNGYDAPWPGGGGTNKLPIKEEYIVLYKYINNNGEILGNNNNFYVDYYIPVTPNTEYNITITTPISYCSIMEYDENKTFIARNLFNCTASTEFATETQVFTTSSNTKYVLFGANLDSSRVSLEKVLSYKYQFQTGNFTGFTPYENICPIQGWKTITAWDDAKYGGNIEWNQLVKNGNFENTTDWGGVGCTIQAENHVCNCTLTVATNLGVRIDTSQYVPRISGHKYISSIDVFVPKIATSARLYPAGNRYEVIASIPANEWTTLYAYITENSDSQQGKTQFFLGYSSDNGYEVGDVFQVRNVNTFDLTQMFGAGNEPATVEEFKALFPNDYYPYNAGEHTCVGAVNGEPYRKVPVTFGAVGKNLWNGILANNVNIVFDTKPGQTYTASAKLKGTNDCYLYLNSSVDGFQTSELVGRILIGQRIATVTFAAEAGKEYALWSNASYTEADQIQIELGSTATAYEPYTDTIYSGTLDLVTGDGVIDMKSVDLGTLTWEYQDNYARFRAQFTDYKHPATSTIVANMLCEQYKPVDMNATRSLDSRYANSTIALATDPYNYVYLVNTAYTDPSELTPILVGCKMVYELETPIHFHVDGVSVTPLKGKNNVWTDCGDTLSVTYISSDVSSAVGYAKTDEATAV